MLELPKFFIEKIYSKGVTEKALTAQSRESIDLTLELLELQGLSLTLKEGKYIPSTFLKPLNDQTFCIVDIETNGSKKKQDQVIEIGAIKIKNGKSVDAFNSTLRANTLPDVISKLTGISKEELQKAPHPKEVMQKFRLFLGDAIFIAHALKFDYEFVSEMFERANLGSMLNVGICTIDLAERTIESQKYGLSFLNETLFNEPIALHRAYNDALLTSKLLKLSLKKLPKEVNTLKKLYYFTKNSPRLKKPAKEDKKDEKK